MGQLGVHEHERSRIKAAFQCTHTMGEPAPSLHRESTDSLIGHPAMKLLFPAGPRDMGKRIAGSITSGYLPAAIADAYLE